VHRGELVTVGGVASAAPVPDAEGIK
jgi:hypothetical protein